LLLAGGLTLACGGDLISSDDDSTPINGIVPGGPARALYLASVQPIHDQVCAPCHGPGGSCPVHFVTTDTSAYDVLMTSGHVVPGEPAHSRLLQWGPSTQHTGTEYTPAQAQLVSDWITAEQPTDVVVETRPFEVTAGSNTIDLSGPTPGLADVRLTFTAALPTAASSTELFLTGVSVQGGISGVRLSRPLFRTWCPTAADDPTDTFRNVRDLTLGGGATQNLSGGTLLLSAYPTGCHVSVRFNRLTPLERPCTSTTLRTTYAVPALDTSCASCHGGANANAVGALDLRTVDTVAQQRSAQVAHLCAHVRAEANLYRPDPSVLFQRVAPGQAFHQFSFVSSTDSAAFTTAVNRWLLTEAP
jgi:mono/diheme cytochrome c family protein